MNCQSLPREKKEEEFSAQPMKSFHHGAVTRHILQNYEVYTSSENTVLPCKSQSTTAKIKQKLTYRAKRENVFFVPTAGEAH